VLGTGQALLPTITNTNNNNANTWIANKHQQEEELIKNKFLILIFFTSFRGAAEVDWCASPAAGKHTYI
jgi:hypothetical protein